MHWRILTAAAAMIVAGGSTLADAPKARPLVTPLISVDRNSAGQPIVFPQKDGRITVSVYTLPPGATVPVHKHPFPRLGYVLSGTLRVTNIEDRSSAVYKAGEVIVESVNAWHKGDNAGPDVLRLLVIDMTETGAPTSVIRR